jgi:choline dehydrogenase-like flavoprotein
MKEKLKGRVLPDSKITLNEIDAKIKYIRSLSGKEFHPIATASLGLVVDERLNVKEVKGLKFCDANIFSLLMSGNNSSPCYVVEEKAADLIKENIKRSGR